MNPSNLSTILKNTGLNHHEKRRFVDKIDKSNENCQICQQYKAETLTKLIKSDEFVKFVRGSWRAKD